MPAQGTAFTGGQGWATGYGLWATVADMTHVTSVVSAAPWTLSMMLYAIDAIGDQLASYW